MYITKTSNSKTNTLFVIAIDSTGIKVTNRGQWMREKRYIKNKKGYLKIHVVVAVDDVKTNKKILSMMKVTDDEHVHNSSKMLPELVENIINLKTCQLVRYLLQMEYMIVLLFLNVLQIWGSYHVLK